MAIISRPARYPWIDAARAHPDIEQRHDGASVATLRLHSHMTHDDPQQSHLVVELSGASADTRLTCTLPDWNFVRDLGQTFGWRPAGTTYLPQRGQRLRPDPIKHDYQPGDRRDRKCVEAADAALWAAALDGARSSPFISDMLRTSARGQDGSDATSDHTLRFLSQFIEFARLGSFTIAFRSDGEHAEPSAENPERPATKSSTDADPERFSLSLVPEGAGSHRPSGVTELFSTDGESNTSGHSL